MLIGVWLIAGVACNPLWGRAVAYPEPQDGAASDKAQPREVYWLRVTGDAVNLRSRGDANSPAVMRVERDAVLRATSSQFGWHEVLPPEGAFSFVHSKYIDVRSDDSGIVSVASGKLRVRVGSRVANLDPWKSEVQTLLERGTSVKIVGRQGEWLQIVPPEGVHAYVSDDFVERVSAEVAARLQIAQRRATAHSVPTSAPATGAAAVAQQIPTAPDLAGTWGQRLALIESGIEAEVRKPVMEQDWGDLIAKLRPIAEQREEPMVARLADGWIARLEVRLADHAAAVAAEQIARRDVRDRERFEGELERIERVRQQTGGGPTWHAQGELVLSYARRPDGKASGFTLQQPRTHRLIAYLEFSPETKIDPNAYVKKYVGVRGERMPNPKLDADVILVTRIAVLDAKRSTTRPSRKAP